MTYPTEFYVAHAEFPTLPGRPWGQITDGPHGFDDALDDVCEQFKTAEDGTPSRENLRVWHIKDKVAEDVTDAFIVHYDARHAHLEVI